MQNLGHYRIESQIGQGAMGIVYRAIDTRLDRTVALKVLRLSLSDQERAEYAARLQQEAKSAARLNHPGIITVFECGDVDGYAYLAMEFVEGKSLQALTDSGIKFSAGRVQKLADQLFGALAYAHEHEVVHRDIKPANLMFTPDGRLKITDFGIAMMPASDLTRTGTLVGSPRHMAPEQIEGKKVDGRADLFAAGIVLYELLTGIKPFDGEHLASIAYKILHENVADPRNFNPDISDTLAAVVMRCLEKDPQKRFQTAREARTALRAAKLEGKASEAAVPTDELPPPTGKLRRYLPWAAGGVVVLALGGIFLARPHHAPAEAIAEPAAVAAPVQTASVPATVPEPAQPAPAAASPEVPPAAPSTSEETKPEAPADQTSIVVGTEKTAKPSQAKPRAKPHVVEHAPALAQVAKPAGKLPGDAVQTRTAAPRSAPAADTAKPDAGAEKADNRTFWQRLRGCDEDGKCPEAQPHTKRDK